ncbi:MAG: hypothetical protein KZQ83_08845 [gamma proteobacterium symbiont of Taylorina sp.]|nr:hypothetical protein [gamma proteobacterium symbiont of Taylorina sp.]
MNTNNNMRYSSQFKILKRSLILLLLSLSVLFISACLPDKAQKTIEHTENALSITLSHNAQYVLIAHSQGYVELRDIESSQVIAQWQHNDNAGAGVIAADFSSIFDSEASTEDLFVVTAEQNNLALYSIKQKKILYFWSLNDIRDIKLSADGEFALVSSRDKSGEFPLFRIVYFHLRTGTIKYGFYHDDNISSIALSADGRFALSGSDDTKARLWDLETGEIAHIWPHVSKVSKVQLSPNGDYAMTNAASEGIYIWDTKTGKQLHRLNKIRATLASAVFSPDSKKIATGYSREEIILWDVKSGKKLTKWKPERRYYWQSSLANVTTLAFKNEKILVSETSRGILQVWNISK